MSLQDEPIQDRECAQAENVLESVKNRLKKAGESQWAEHAALAYKYAEPYLIKGRHLNPIHHIAYVLKFMVEIMFGQIKSNDHLEITRDDFIVGIWAAIFHDTGNAFEPEDEKKIRIRDVREEPSLLKAAIEQRTRHMDNGAKLVESFMRDTNKFTGDQVLMVRSLVQHHDYPTVAELISDITERNRYLFVPDKNHPLSRIYPLSVFLREADRLWMLTIPGIGSDLKRDRSGGKHWSPPEQIAFNIQRHEDERKLYQDYLNAGPEQLSAGELQARLEAWGFDKDTAFYRSVFGKEKFRELVKASIDISGNK